MALSDKEISELTETENLNNTDLIIVTQNDQSYKAQLSKLAGIVSKDFATTTDLNEVKEDIDTINNTLNNTVKCTNVDQTIDGHKVFLENVVQQGSSPQFVLKHITDNKNNTPTSGGLAYDIAFNDSNSLVVGKITQEHTTSDTYKLTIQSSGKDKSNSIEIQSGTNDSDVVTNVKAKILNVGCSDGTLSCDLNTYGKMTCTANAENDNDVITVKDLKTILGIKNLNAFKVEEWQFTLTDGTTIVKNVLVQPES